MSSGVERNIHRYFVNKIHFVKKCDTKLLKREFVFKKLMSVSIARTLKS